MSNHLTSAAYKRNLRTHTRKAVLLILADKASDDGSGIWASKQRMADELCMSKQTVINTVKAFMAEGLLREVSRKPCTNGYTVEYALDVPKLEALPLVKWHDDNQSKGWTGKADRPVNLLDGTSQPAGPDQSTTLTQTPLNHPEPQEVKSSDDDALSPDDVIEGWNAVAEECGLPVVRKLTDARKRKLRTRLKQFPDIEDWRRALTEIRANRWMHGDNDRGWRADFDFLLQDKSFTKLTEGAYGKAG